MEKKIPCAANWLESQLLSKSHIAFDLFICLFKANAFLFTPEQVPHKAVSFTCAGFWICLIGYLSKTEVMRLCLLSQTSISLKPDYGPF